MNLYAHYSMFQKFKKRAPRNVSTYWLWHFMTAVCIHGWIWSTIFHARDTPFTEFMDYSCAFSMVMISFYCMVRRVFINMSGKTKLIVNAIILTFFLNHVLYLYQGINYGYNMKINVIVGKLRCFLRNDKM